jgi:hypothetical protein
MGSWRILVLKFLFFPFNGHFEIFSHRNYYCHALVTWHGFFYVHNIRCMVTDPKIILCLRLYWLATVSHSTQPSALSWIMPETHGLLAMTVHSLAISASHCPSLALKVKVTLRLAVYRQSIRLFVKPLETHGQRLFLNWTLAVITLKRHPLTRKWVFSHKQDSNPRPSTF